MDGFWVCMSTGVMQVSHINISAAGLKPLFLWCLQETGDVPGAIRCLEAYLDKAARCGSVFAHHRASCGSGPSACQHVLYNKPLDPVS
jgi:hypothetical protein